MARLLRYNRWQTDPLANGSACDQLACRADLLVDETPAADGAVNAKFTSASRVARGEMRFIAGPTSDDQPVFQWSTAPASVRAEPHAGQPDRWDFPWQTLEGKEGKRQKRTRGGSRTHDLPRVKRTS